MPSHAADLLGAWDWDVDDPVHGGYSAIEMAEGGRIATVLSDRGRLLDLRLDRSSDGKITAVTLARSRTISKPPVENGRNDTEGLAIAPDGRIFISFEGRSLVAEYLGSDARPRPLPIPPTFDAFSANRGLEALAIAPDGSLWTVPEKRRKGAFATHIWRDGAWQKGPRLLSDGTDFVPTGLDFDDRGRLYLLERQFLGPFGFRSRLRRFTLDKDSVLQAEILLETDAGEHDNLEGVAIWRDTDTRLIATMISDDNFFPLQRTEFVEYALPD